MSHTIKIDNITYQVSAELAAGINKVLQEVAENPVQEQVDKGWEVIEYAELMGIWQKLPDGMFKLDPFNKVEESAIIKEGYPIHGIRVGIGEQSKVWRIRDKCQPGISGDAPIIIVEIEQEKTPPNRFKVWFDSDTWQWAHLLQPYKEEPKEILRTEDGVSIYDPEQIVYGVDPLTWKTIKCTANEWVNGKWMSTKGWNYYSTEAARTEYIMQNRPVLSMADLQSVNNYKETDNYLYIDRDRLEELVKSKIG